MGRFDGQWASLPTHSWTTLWSRFPCSFPVTLLQDPLRGDGTDVFAGNILLIHGLHRAVQYNGLPCRVLAGCEADKKFPVALATGRQLKVPLANLQRIPNAAFAALARDATNAL